MRVPIRYKITLVFGVIVAIILLGIYAYLNNTLRQHTYQRIRDNLIKQTNLAKTYIEEDFFRYPGDYGLDNLADKISRDLGLRVTIIGIDGTVLGDSGLEGVRLKEIENHLSRPEVQEALSSKMGESRRFSTTVRKNMLYIATVYGSGKNEGVIRLAMPLLEIEAVSGRIKKTLGAAFLITFIISIAVSFLASVFISSPIRKISFLSQRIARGDFSRKAAIVSRDEFGDLAKFFNYMAEQINLKIQEVTLSKSRLEAVFLSLMEGVMVVDTNCSILLMNQALKDFLAVKTGPIGKKPIEVIRNIEIQNIVERALKRSSGVEACEISVIVPEEKILLVHATPVIRENRSEGAVLVFHDVTNLRQLEKIRQDFVANVSHELRTPVTSIKGYAETLLAGALTDKKNARDFLKIIYTDSDRLAKLIDDLLDLSKLESGKLKLNMKPCRVKPLVERIVAILKAWADKNSIKISVDIPNDLPKVSADPAAVAQVLLNLVDNAIKYNQRNGSVNITAEEQGRFVRINVSDTGVGIPEKDLPRIFERFYRVDKTRSRELGGTGLGLSIVKHIIQAHNGEASVKSTLGRGATFSFTLPKA